MRKLTLDIIEETNIDGVNHAQYMEINDIPSFELKRDDIEFIRLLGSGNFGEVFKANIGHVTVAVKSLKGMTSTVSLDLLLLSLSKHHLLSKMITG